MRFFALVGILVLLFVGGWIGYPYVVAPQAPGPDTAIFIKKAINRLYLYENGEVVRIYPVATGRDLELTPEGDFNVVVKEANAHGIGKDSVFGARWIGLSVPRHEDGLTYGIHGTNEPESIGTHASAGCVRMTNEDVENLYSRVPIGTIVRIRQGSVIHRYIRYINDLRR